MKERIRVDGIAREEVRADFPGSSELQERILAAHQSGDVDLLRELQREYREARMAASAGQVMRVTAPAQPAPRPTRPAVLRTATSAESTVADDIEREVVGYLLCWGSSLTATQRDGGGEAIYLDVQPDDVRRWLREVDPHQVPVLGDHVTEPVGFWRMFAIDEIGLQAVALLDDTPAGHEVIAASFDGRATGLSASMDIPHAHETGNTREGLRCFVAGPVAVREGSVVVTPADPRCEILRVGGRLPVWVQQRDAVERDVRMRRMWGLR